MNDLQKRILLFLGLCIPSRFLLAYIAKVLPLQYLPLMGILLLGPVIGWIYIYITNSRNSGLETFGAPIWWNYMRPIHAFLYFICALLAFNKNPRAYMLIIIDTIIGLLSFLKYHKFI